MAGRILITVEDDGGGFIDDRAAKGFGLAGMKERVRSAGRTVSVRNREGCRGVGVEAYLPLGSSDLPIERDKAAILT